MAAHRPHLVQRDRLAQTRGLPRRFAAGQSAADDVNHPDILSGAGGRRRPNAAGAGSVECRMRGVLAGCAIVAALSCGGGGATGPSPVTQAETLELRWQSEHFRIFAGATPDGIVRATADRLESEFARILTALELSTVPGVTVRIWQDEATYTAELVRYFGVRYQATGYITGPVGIAAAGDPPARAERRSRVRARRQPRGQPVVGEQSPVVVGDRRRLRERRAGRSAVARLPAPRRLPDLAAAQRGSERGDADLRGRLPAR